MQTKLPIMSVCLAVGVGLAATSAHATETFADDFNDDSLDRAKWPSYSTWYDGVFTEVRQHLEFTTQAAPAPNHNNEAFLRSPPLADYTADFRLVVDLANLTEANPHRGTHFLVELGSATDSGDHLCFRFADDSSGRVFLSTVLVGNWQNVAGNQGGTEVFTDRVRIRIDFDARTKVLSTHYDTNPLDQDNWIPLQAFGIDGDGGTDGNVDWGMTGTSSFSLGLRAQAFFDDVANYETVQPGQMYVDNVVVSAERQLLRDGFEIGTDPATSYPTATGVWGGNFARIVAATNTISPLEGTHALQFVSTDSDPDGGGMVGVGCNLYRLVDCSAIRPLVEAGQARLNLTAFFNRVRGTSTTDTAFTVSLYAFAGSISSFPSLLLGQAYLAVTSGDIITDSDPVTWEPASASLLLPSHTDFAAVRIDAWENVSNDAASEFDGHSADRVTLQLADESRQPVPSIYTAVEICWPSALDQLYQVQYAPSPDTNLWLNLGVPVWGSGSTNCVFDSTRNGSKRFYRVIGL